MVGTEEDESYTNESKSGSCVCME